MRLYFVRHGLAGDGNPSDPNDHLRPLTEDGIRKMEATAKRFLDFGITPAVIYTSPLTRALQTAEIVAKALKCPLEQVDLLKPGFNEIGLQSLISRHQIDADVMLVGHGPDMGLVIGKAINGGDITMKKGGLARVDVLRRTPLQGTLVWLLPPKVQ